jgi:hypothetical protein
VGDVSRFATLATVSSTCLRCVEALKKGRPITDRHTGSEGDLCDSLRQKRQRSGESAALLPRTKRDTRGYNDADQATSHVQRRDPDVLYRPHSIGSRAPAVSDVILRITSQTTGRARCAPPFVAGAAAVAQCMEVVAQRGPKSFGT